LLRNTRPSITLLIASGVLYFAALLAKETAIVTLVVFFAVALLSYSSRLRRADEAPDFGSRLADAFRGMPVFVAATLAYLLLRLHAVGVLSASTQHLPWSTVLFSLPATLWFYVKALLWPVRSHAFGNPTETEVFALHTVLLPGFAVCCAAALLGLGAFWAFRKAARDLPEREAVGVRGGLVLGILLLVLPLAPALNLNGLNPEDYLHGRYTYLSSAGLMLLLATGLHLATRIRTPLLIAAGSLALAFLVLTVSQEVAWKDDLTVFTEGQRNAPRNVFVARNLVRAHVEEALRWDVAGHCHPAVPVFEDAIRQFPNDWYGWAGLGDCLDQLNDLPRAEQALRRAADLAHQAQVTDRWREVRRKLENQSQPGITALK
jgi:hypothetical protein